MREKLLEKSFKKSLDDSLRKKINRKLEKLKKDMQGQWVLTYGWNEGADALFVKIFNLDWTVFFHKKKVAIFVEFPFYLLPFLKQFQKQAIEILEKEVLSLLELKKK